MLTPTSRRLATLGACVACLAFESVWAFDATPQETIARVKQSVVAVGTFQPTRNPSFRFLGTGFVVGDGSLIATNEHVIPRHLDREHKEQLAVAIQDGKKIQMRSAALGPTNLAADLAILTIEGPALRPLTLGDADKVREGDQLLFTGFPIGTALGLIPATHRAMIAALTPLAVPAERARQLDPKIVRQLTDGPISVFQLDGTAYPGNSGSPLYRPDTGEVVGVINMIFVKASRETALSDPSGISYAVPAKHLQNLLDSIR